MDFGVPLEIAFGVYFGRFRQKAAPGDDFGAILGRTFAGSIFYRFLMIFEVARTRKNKQNHDTVIKNQGFAEVCQSRFGDRFFIDFGVDFRRFGHQFGTPER